MTETLTREDLALLDAIVTEAIDPIAPPPSLRDRILSEAFNTPQNTRTVRANEGRWHRMVPGVTVKLLSMDMERDTATGHIATSPFSDVLGLCLAHKDFRYDSNNDGQITVDDATWPDCSSLPIVEATPDAPSARKFGCVTATTSRYPLGFTSTPLVELPWLPYGETLRRK